MTQVTATRTADGWSVTVKTSDGIATTRRFGTKDEAERFAALASLQDEYTRGDRSTDPDPYTDDDE